MFIFLEIQTLQLYLHPNSTETPLKAPTFREHSSAGSEHLPYKQRVTGSNPVAPTDKRKTALQGVFFVFGTLPNLFEQCGGNEKTGRAQPGGFSFTILRREGSCQ
jgi:hypothetical protein